MIQGNELRDALISGANAILKHKTQVDELNIFPVPDGDTGTNMSMTMGSAAKALADAQGSAGEIAKIAASALLRGYFSKLFKQTMGIGYCEYVTKLRMTRAPNLLCTTSHKIGDISRQVGFDSIP